MPETPTPPTVPLPVTVAKTPHSKPSRRQGLRLPTAQLEQLEHFIRQQEVTGLTDAAIAELLGISRQSVINHRRRLAAGLEPSERVSVPLRASMERTGPSTAAPFPPSEQAPFDRVFDVEEPLTGEQSLRLLSYIARSSPNANAQVAALRALEVLRVQIEAPSRLGPGPPLTEEDQVARLALIIEAVGLTITRKALDRAHPTKGA